jgi:hypothetical protein
MAFTRGSPSQIGDRQEDRVKHISDYAPVLQFCRHARATAVHCKFRRPHLLRPHQRWHQNTGGVEGTERNMGTGVKLRRDVMAAIGRELRVTYADIVAEGLPQRFANILRRLDESSDEDAKRDEPHLLP